MKARVVSIADETLDQVPYSLGWFSFFIEDWRGGTKHMEADERGIYLDFIVAFYDHGAPLRDNDHDLARECRCSVRVWRRVKQRLLDLEKIVIRDGLIRHAKCEAVLRKAKTSSKLRRNSGRKGGRKRAENYAKVLKDNRADQANAKALALAGLKDTQDHLTVPKGTGAEAPGAGPSEERKEDPTPPLPASDLPVPAPASRLETVWSDKPGGAIWQLTQMGAGRQSAGGMIATLRKKHEDDVIVQAVALTWADHGRTFVADPRTRVLFHLNRLSGRSGGKPEFNPHLI